MLPAGFRKVKKPKMTEHFGRTWDTCTVVLPDGTETQGWLDYSWGTRFYFQYNGQWYAGSIDEWEYSSSGRRSLVLNLTQERKKR